jgi:hypothetical protein
MAFSINDLSLTPDHDLLYEQPFRRLLEAYLPWIRTHPSTTLIAVDPHHTYKYEGDFYGLLDALHIQKPLHWLVLRLNDYYRAGEVYPTLQWLAVPDPTLIEKLKQLYRRKKKHALTQH